MPKRRYRKAGGSKYIKEARDRYLSQNALGTPASKAFWGPTKAEAWRAYQSGEDPNPWLRRKMYHYYGPGDYRSWAKYIPRAIGGLAGGAASWMRGAGLGGSVEGAKAGWDQGANFSKNFLGWGDYSANQIVDSGAGTNQQITVNRDSLTDDIYMCRTEFIGNVTASNSAAGASSFQITKYSLNPGLQQSYPILAQIASNFELYDWEGLIYQFKPTFTENAGTSNNLGKVIMATNYDVSAPDFISAVQMENYAYANSSKPSDGMIHGVETDNQHQFGNMLYVRTGQVSRDLSFYDLGNFYVATEGIPFTSGGTQILGELWVTYKIRLSRMQIVNSQLLNTAQHVFLSGTSSAAALTTGTTGSKSGNSFTPIVFPVSSTSFQLQFPRDISLGCYQVLVQFASGATVFTTQTGAVPSNRVNCQTYLPGLGLPGGTTALLGPQTVVGTTSNVTILICFYVYVNAPNQNQATVDINVSAALTATTTWRMWISQVSFDDSVSLTV